MLAHISPTVSVCIYPKVVTGRDEVCGACTKHQQVLARIAEAEVLLLQLKQEERITSAKVNESHDRIRATPPEIMSQIFQFAVHEDAPYRVSPLRLGRVCRFWRQVTWSTPSLWKKVDFILYPDVAIEMDTPYMRSGSLRRRTGLLKEYIHRAGVLQLEMDISGGCDLDETCLSHNDLLPLVDILKWCAPRLSYLKLQLPGSVLRLLEGVSAPLLRTLELKGTPLGEEYDPPVNLESFTRSIQSLKVEHFSVESAELSYEKVEVLDVKKCTPSSCLRAFGSSKILRTCELEMTEGVIFPELYATPFQSFDRLQDLRINYSGLSIDFDLGEFFAQVKMPDLRLLGLTADIGRFHWQPVHAEKIVGLFQRSSCPLRSLVLCSVSSASCLTEVLRAVPSLEALQILHKLPGTSLTDAFNAIFPTSLSEPMQYPQISYLQYSTEWGAVDDVDPWDCLSHLHSYWRNSTHRLVLKLDVEFPLLDIPDHGWLTLQSIHLVEELRDEGHEISITGRKHHSLAYDPANFYEDFVVASIAFHQRLLTV